MEAAIEASEREANRKSKVAVDAKNEETISTISNSTIQK